MFSDFMSVFGGLASINTLNFVMPLCLHFLNGDNYDFFIISVKISEDLLVRECLISARYYNTADEWNYACRGSGSGGGRG